MVRDRDNQGWRIHYGWRGGGEKFLAHVEDIRIAPHLYMPLETRPAAPRVEKRTPAAPTSLVEEAFMEDTSEPPPPPTRIDLDKVMEPDDSPKQLDRYSEWQTAQQTTQQFDWQRLPGVTAKIATRLEGLGLQDVVEMGEEGLQNFEYVGPARAKAIYAAAVEALGG